MGTLTEGLHEAQKGRLQGIFQVHVRLIQGNHSRRTSLDMFGSHVRGLGLRVKVVPAMLNDNHLPFSMLYLGITTSSPYLGLG